MEFPKQLYRQGWADLSDTVVVNSAEEEEAARGEGFKHLAESEDACEAEAPKRGRKPKAETIGEAEAPKAE